MHVLKGVGTLLGALAILWGCGEGRDYAALARLYATSYPQLTEFALPNAAPSYLADGLKAYQRADYPETIALLSQLPPADTAYAAAQLYLGIALFEQQNYEAAAAALQLATQADGWKVYEPAQFYLALSLLAQGLPEASCTWLMPDGYKKATTYYPKVKELHHRLCQ